MMQYWMSKLFFLSLAGGAAGALVLTACRVSGRKLRYAWRYYLCLVPAVLFVLPMTLPAPPVRAANTGSVTVEAAPTQHQAPAPAEPPAAADVLPLPVADANAAAVPTPVPAAVPRTPPDPWAAAAALWLAGVLFQLSAGAAQYVRFKRLTKRATWPADPPALLDAERARLGLRRRVSLRYFAGGGSPFVTGVCRPTVYLPDVPLPEADLRQVLTHELTHVRRGDLLYKKLLRAVRVVHWFNPAAWLLEREAARYCELSCDEAVVRDMNREARRAYGFAILRLMQGADGRAPSSAYLAEQEIKNRLEAIMEAKTHGKRLIAGVLTAALCLSGAALAAGVNTANPNNARTTYASAAPLRVENVLHAPDAQGGYRVLPGSGRSDTPSGTARLVRNGDTHAFTADVRTAALVSTYQGVQSDAGPQHFEVEMTKFRGELPKSAAWVGDFTVKQNGKTIFENTTGRLTGIPGLGGARRTQLELRTPAAQNVYSSFCLDVNFNLTGAEELSTLAAADAARAAVKNAADCKKYSLNVAESTFGGRSISRSMPMNSTLYYSASARKAYMELLLGRADLQEPYVVTVLTLEPTDVTSCADGTVRGVFRLQDSAMQDAEFSGSITGLDGGAGAAASLRSDDGAYALDLLLEDAEAQNRQEAQFAGYRGQSIYTNEQYAQLSAQATSTGMLLEEGDAVQLSAIPFTVKLGGDGVTVHSTGGADRRWSAALFTQDEWDQTGGRRHDPERTVTDTATPDAVALPFQGKSGFMVLQLQSYTAGQGAHAETVTLSLYHNAQRTLSLSCRRTEMQNPGVSGDVARNYLKQYLPLYVYGEQDRTV